MVMDTMEREKRGRGDGFGSQCTPTQLECSKEHVHAFLRKQYRQRCGLDENAKWIYLERPCHVDKQTRFRTARELQVFAYAKRLWQNLHLRGISIGNPSICDKPN